MPKYDHKEDAKKEEEEKKVASKKGKKKKKKKPSGPAGIGYTSGAGKIWDVNAYLKNKEAKNQQIIKLLEVL